MDPQIEFVVELAEKDIAGMYDETSARWRKRCLFPGIAISIVAIAGIFLQPDWVFESPANATVTFTLILIGFLSIYCGTFMVGAFRRAAIRRFRLSPSAAGKIKYEFFDDHLTLNSELVHSEIRWGAFLTRKEMPGYLSLVFSPTSAFVIPLAQLPPDLSLNLREFVRSHLPSLDTKAIYRIAFRRGQPGRPKDSHS